MPTSTNKTLDTSVTATVENLATRGVRLVTVVVRNPSAAYAYLQLFDAAAADVTLGTTAPNQSFPVPPSGQFDLHFGERGMEFQGALSYAWTTTVAGNTAPASNAEVNFGWL